VVVGQDPEVGEQMSTLSYVEFANHLTVWRNDEEVIGEIRKSHSGSNSFFFDRADDMEVSEAELMKIREKMKAVKYERSQFRVR
jgi:hypothetical protein